MAIPRQKVIVSAIWVWALLDAVRQGITLPSSELPQFSPAFSMLPIAFGLLAPPVLIVLNNIVPVRSRWHAATTGRLRLWIDRRWGDGSVQGFIDQLRPLALIMSACLLLGISGLISSYAANAAPYAFELSGFFVSAGVGFAIGLLIQRVVFKNASWV